MEVRRNRKAEKIGEGGRKKETKSKEEEVIVREGQTIEENERRISYHGNCEAQFSLVSATVSPCEAIG